VALEELEAARQRRLIDGQSLFELPQIRLPRARDGGEDAVLGHAQTARPQPIVVELRDRAGHDSQGVADTRRRAKRVIRRTHASSSANGLTLPAMIATWQEREVHEPPGPTAHLKRDRR